MRTGKKKIAIVTGASSGMGRECVVQLADRFAGLEEIWVIARRGRRLDKLAGKVPVLLRVLELDLQDELAFAELEEKLEWEDPEVKILVNGAGFGKIGCTEDLQLDEEAGMIDVNCRALTAVTRLVLPYIKKQPHPAVCLRGCLSAAAAVCRVCSHKGFCAELQPCPGHGAETTTDLCNGSLSGSCQNGIF